MGGGPGGGPTAGGESDPPPPHDATKTSTNNSSRGIRRRRFVLILPSEDTECVAHTGMEPGSRTERDGHVMFNPFGISRVESSSVSYPCAP